MEIRQATTQDSKYIEHLYKERVNNSSINVHPDRIEQIFQDEHNFLFIIELNKNVKGTCFVTFCLDPMYGKQPFVLIENIIVSSDSRKKGVGPALLQYVESFCLNRDCSKIILQSSNKRQDAHAFFKALGYDQKNKTGFVKYRRNFNG